MLSSLKAIVWLRWRLLANSVRGGKRRDRLEQVSRAFAVFVPIIIAALLTSSVVAMLAIGFMGGRAAAAGTARPAVVVMVMRGLLVMMTIVLVILTTSSPGQTSIGRYTRLLLLPIPRSALHLVEVIANLADPWIVLVAAGLLALPAGILAGGDPVGAVIALAAGLAMLAVLVSLGALISFLVGWLFRSRRRSELFTLVFVGVLSLVSFIPMMLTGRLEGRKAESRRTGQSRPSLTIEEFDRLLPAWTRALPSELYGGIVVNGFAGNPVSAGVGLLALGGQAIVLFVASSAAHRRMLGALEGGAKRRRSVEQPMAALPVPGLTPAVSAIAWAQVRTALRTVRGRLVVLLPGPLLAVLALVLSRVPEEAWAVMVTSRGQFLFGAGIVFSLYSLQAFSMNLFGADRAGLTLQLLSPIRDRELAWGKVIGCGLIFGVAIAFCLIASVAVAPSGSPLMWLAVFLAAVATYLLLSPIFVWLSALFPLASDLSKTGSGGNPHSLPMLVGTFLVLFVAAPAAVVVLVAEFWWKQPALGLAAMVVWLLISAMIGVPSVNLASRAIGARRENLALTAQGR
jgi:hypothetical protein